MPRYVSRPKPKADDDVFWEDRMLQPMGHPIVFEDGPTRTGLVTKDGHEIWRWRDQIGFVRRS